MKTKTTRPIGKLAEARLLFEAATKVAEQTRDEFESLLDSASLFDSIDEKLTREVYMASVGRQLLNAQDNLYKAQNRLLEIVDQMRPGAATVTATNKDRVPFVTPEMESDWDKVQDAIANQDDELQFAKWRKSSSVDNPHCKGCRRMKARVNANSKPHKGHK